MNVLIIAATIFEITSKNILKKPVLISGVGMVNTAINLTKELCHKQYDLVINMGVAGSFTNTLQNGDVVEVTQDNFSEIGFEDNFIFRKFTEFNLKTQYSVMPRTSLEQVCAITVNTVHGNKKSIAKIRDRIDCQIETMEGASVFKVCEEFNVPCVQIRAISNKIELRNKDNWDLDLAIKNLNIEVEKILENL